MAAIYTKEALEAWLDGQPILVRRVISSRIALRVAPMLVRMPIQNSKFLLAGLRALRVCRIYASSAEERNAAVAYSARKFASHNVETASSPTASFAIRAAIIALAGGTGTVGARIAEFAARAAESENDLWADISEDARLISISGVSPEELNRRPLWLRGTPRWAEKAWANMQLLLSGSDEDWEVWTDWYEDCLTGAPIKVELERAIAGIPENIWDGVPSDVNAEIRKQIDEHDPSPESESEIVVPEQRPAIVEAEVWPDNLVHRRQPPPPKARDKEHAENLREAWQAHRDFLEEILNLDPGRNVPPLAVALRRYESALGKKYESLNVISLGIHGERILAQANISDETQIAETAAEIKAFAAAHGLFIRQFDRWLEYVDGAIPEPSDDLLKMAAETLNELRSADGYFADDVLDPLGELADAAQEKLQGEPGHSRGEFFRSLGNALAAFFKPIVEGVRRGLEGGSEELTKRIIVAVGLGTCSAISILAAGYPSEFGWVAVAASFLTAAKIKM